MIKFQTQGNAPEAGPIITGLDPEGLQDRMVAGGHMVFEVIWDGYGPLKLAVEDDVMFLCEAYQELAAFLEKGGTHDVFLGDGVLQMKATREGDVVHVVCTNVPFLHRGLMTKKEYAVNLSAYVDAWTRLIRELVDLAKSAPTEEHP
jgi:hypothetical protein